MVIKNDSALKWNKRDALAIAVLIILWGLFFWRFFTLNPVNRVTFARGDFTYQFYTFRAFAFRELRAGRIPLWIPCTFCGAPFLADSQTALAYPPVTLSLLAALGLGLNTYTAFRVVPLAVGLFLLCEFIAHRERWKFLLGRAGIFVLSAALTLIPLSVYVVKHWPRKAGKTKPAHR